MSVFENIIIEIETGDYSKAAQDLAALEGIEVAEATKVVERVTVNFRKTTAQNKSNRKKGKTIGMHIYKGKCPDSINGPYSRDPACPVCQALIENDKKIFKKKE